MHSLTRSRHWPLLLGVLVTAVCAALPPVLLRAQVASTLTVTVATNRSPVEGAFVAAIGPDANRFAGMTNSSGQYTFHDLPDGSYTVRGGAPGTTVGVATVTLPAATTANIAVASSGTIFTGLGAFGAGPLGLAADGRSGVFYVSTNVIPSLYRTHDDGGSWAPVTISSDDRTGGIDGSSPVSLLTASGYPGEVAGATRDKVWFSRDFGVSWSSIPLPPLTGGPGAGGMPPARLFWAHPRASGASSRLFLVANETSDIYYADITSTTPTGWTAMTSSYRTAAGDKAWIASGESSIFIAVAAAAGSQVSIYRMGATPDRAADPSTTIANGAPPSPPTFIRLAGNVSSGEVIGGSGGRSPNAVLVYSNGGTTATTPPSPTGNGAAVMSIYTGSTWSPTTATSFRNGADDNQQTIATGFNVDNGVSCLANTFGAGAIGPSGSVGSIARCWVEASAGTLIVRPVSGAHNNLDFTFDSGFGGVSGNRVILSGDGSKGLAKSDRMNTTLNRPDFPGWPTLAAPGFSLPSSATTTGGISINGLNAAEIGDTIFQPNSVQNMAVAMSAGGRVVGSRDAGVTWFTLSAIQGRGGTAIDWWTSAGATQWILAGAGDRGGSTTPNLTAAFLATPSAFTSSTTLAQVPGTAGPDFGFSDRTRVTAIAGLTGTDKAVVATVQLPEARRVTGAVLSLLTLSNTAGGVTATHSNLGVAFVTGTMPVALAYCPAQGSASSVSDTLFIAVAASTEGGSDGSIMKVTAPAGTAGAAVALAGGTAGDFRDVRVHCGSGTVYAGRYLSGPSPLSGLLAATTSSGTLGTLTPVTTLPNRGRERIETLDIHPSNVNRVVAVSFGGDIFWTINGGTSWRIVNDTSTAGCNATFTTCGRVFGGAVGDIELAPNTQFDPFAGGDENCPRGLCEGQALFGTGGGLFATSLPSTTPEPGTPASFTVTASGLAIAMSWTASPAGEAPTSYLLQVATSNAFSPIVYSQTISGSQTSLQLTAPPGTAGTFFFRLSASNANGTSAATAGVQVQLPGTGSLPLPGAPGTPAVTISASNAIAIGWTAPSSGGAPTGYRIHLALSGTPLPGSPFSVGAVTSVQSPGPLAVGSYSLRISATNAAGEGPQSAAATFTIGSLPGAPGAPQVSVNANNSIAVTWAAASGAVTTYKLYVVLNGSSVSGSPFTVGPGHTIVSPGPLAPGSYSMRVAAVNASGEGPQSGATVFTIAGPAAPGVPGTPVVTINADRSISVTWAASTGTVTTYRVSVARNGVPLPGSPFSVGTLTTVASPGPLPSGGYSLSVSALNSVGESGQSAAVTFTVP